MPQRTPAPSIPREIFAGLVGAGIAVACLLPIPIVHLTLIGILAAVWLYEATLSAAGATVSVALARRKQESPE